MEEKNLKNKTLNTLISVRVSEQDKQQLQNYANITKLSASFFMREGLHLLHEAVLTNNSDLNKAILQAQIEIQAKETVKRLKKLRWIAYLKMSCTAWLRRVDWAKPYRLKGSGPTADATPPIKYMVLLEMTDAMFTQYEREQLMLLSQVNELEKTYEKTQTPKERPL